MKTTIAKAQLTAGLNFTAGIAKSSIIPILSNVLIKKSGHNLTFTVADEVMQLKAVVATDTADEFEFVADYARISTIVSNLPDDAVVNFDIDEDKITIKSGRSKFNIQTLAAADYPLIQPDETTQTITIQQEEFKRLIQSVASSMAVKDTRTQLNGLFFEVQDGTLTLVATDGQRMAFNAIPIDTPNVSRIIPRNTVMRLVKALTSGEMTISFSASNISFSINGNEIVSKIIDAKFPDYRRVIPSNHNQSIAIAKSSLIDSCKRVAIPANDKFRGVRVEIGETMRFTCVSGKETASDEFDISYEGKPVEMGLNADFLIDAANSMAGDFTLSLLDAGGSAVMMKDDAGLIAVVMPMRI